jgi:hypothetical protein
VTVAVRATSTERSEAVVSRLLVTVRDPQDARYRAVGFLTREDGGYGFSYLRREVAGPNFRPLPGLNRAAHGRVHSRSLFPIFAERVISSRRPDRPISLAALGLPEDAEPFEVLVRSHGQRVGDTIELLPAPLVAEGGSVAFSFLAHGVRYLPEANQRRISALAVGDRLRLRRDPDNPVNPRAQLVTDEDDVGLGWMPDPLLQVVDRIQDLRVSVQRSNGPEVGFHFRLLVLLEGRLPLGARLFDGSEWSTLESEDEDLLGASG